MNRPKRPGPTPPRRRPGGPPRSGAPSPGGGPPRRRSPLDFIPQTIEPRFQVLGTGVDRHALLASAEPLELVVAQGFTREIEDAAQKFVGRYEEFWGRHPEMIEKARKVDDILAGIQQRRG